MSAKGQTIKFHGTGEGFGGDDSTVVRGTATVGDFGVGGYPIWNIESRDFRAGVVDPAIDKTQAVAECRLSELAEILSEWFSANIELDF